MEHWEAWQHSIHRAAGWLRDRFGVQHIVLCGLCLGAMLAAAVSAQRSDVAGLILLAPILRGRTYIRQLIIEANLPSIPGKDGFVIGEIALSAETVRRISQAELRHMLPPRGCQVAIYAQSPSPALSECVQQWCTRGVEVACNDFNGLESMLRPTFMNHEPPLTMVRLLDWLSQAIPPSRLASGHPAPVPTVELRTAAWAETPLNFGADHALFGILCRPSKSDLAGIVVVIASTSGDPHCAPVTVDLARRLAVAGIASLRLGFAGLGDSIAPGNHPTHIFEANRLADVSAAIDALASSGYRRFAIQGLCSGAYHAFQAAVGEERIGLVLLINLPLFPVAPWRRGRASWPGGSDSNTPVANADQQDDLAECDARADQPAAAIGLAATMDRRADRELAECGEPCPGLQGALERGAGRPEPPCAACQRPDVVRPERSWDNDCGGIAWTG